MIVDDYGRVIVSEDEGAQMLLEGKSIDELFFSGVDQYNETCKRFKKDYFLQTPDTLEIDPIQFHRDRQSEWFLPEVYASLDFWPVLFDRCKTDEERARLTLERKLFVERQLEPVLRLMIYLVDSFRARNVVWGIGRGSSVASFTLYLLGVTRINPLKYELDIREFLKD